MAKAATKPAQVSAETEPAADPTWQEVIAAAGLYWGPIGRKAAEQVRDYAVKLFDGQVKPAALIFGRPSKIHDQWAPLLEVAAQMRMHEPSIADMRGHGDVKPLVRISRAQLLRGTLGRYLTTNGLNASPGSLDWCRAAMSATERLTGKRVWMSPQTERQVAENEGGFVRRRIVVEQQQGPKGETSVTWTEILAWPSKTIPGLGDITAE